MGTLRVTNIEAKSDSSSPSVDEKVSIRNSNEQVIFEVDGKNSPGVGTVFVGSGIVTATTFTGNVTGNVTGNATGLSGTPDVVVGIVTATEIAGVSTIGVTTVTATTLTVNGNNYPSAGALSNRNLIINGAMQVAQRGTSSSSQTTTGYYTVDRFQYGISTSGTHTLEQSNDGPVGFTNSAKISCTTADTSLDTNSELFIVQKIEAQNLQHLNYGSADAVDLTLSLWVKSNKTGTYAIEIFQADDNRTCGFELVVDQTGWKQYTFTIPGDTTGVIDNDNGIGFWIFLWMVSGTEKTSGTFTNGSWEANVVSNRLPSGLVNFADSNTNALWTTGWQLEVGSVATPFEHRSYGDELVKCQRYYQQITVGGGNNIQEGISWNSTSAVATLYYNEMRAGPDVTLPPAGQSANTMSFLTTSGGYPTTTGNHSATNATTRSVSIYGSSYVGLTVANASWLWPGNNTGSCTFKFDAEI